MGGGEACLYIQPGIDTGEIHLKIMISTLDDKNSLRKEKIEEEGKEGKA